MTELKRLQQQFSESQEDNVYSYIANDLFDLTTYDSAIDKTLVKQIMKTLKWVELDPSSRSKNTSEAQLTEHIITLHLGNVVDWVDWGTSIRHSWIEFDKVDAYLAIKALIQLNDEC